MQSKKKHLAVTVAIILLFSLSSIVQAAPMVQEDSTTPTDGEEQQGDPQDDGTSQEDTIDLSKNNLGRVMSDKNKSDDDDDGDDDDDDGDDGDDDDGDDDSNDTGDSGDSATKLHPVAKALAGFFDVPYEDIAELHEAGNGFGNIAKAYFFADRLAEFGEEAITPEDLLTEAHGAGWGNTLKNYGIHPGAVGNGKNKNKSETEEGEISAQDKQKGSPSFVAPGGGKGNGGVPPGQAKDKSNGNNGNGKNKDKEKGKNKNDD